ncbi:uncharacterized protein N7498_010284 [Penicillium cinerascens]|uniref:DUF8032 domain-containing protein n=1 Tax=Penicillium cinerascens TaxID=70096 RepID=A0A9W9J7M7_9EURO|nr:uncharacterized protein N7498_010284 [Penicillium cinerascens]KAJ5191299.1 hypothetical protein N7498_010284 [Penicillium cinerascens]
MASLEDMAHRHSRSGRPSPQLSQYHHSHQGQTLKQGRASPIQSSSGSTTYPPGNNILHSQSAYGPPSQEPPYYSNQPSSYTPASASAHYPSSGPPDHMAATAQMQRPYPPIYHTPQSNSPASVASQPHDQHARNIYTQSPQMPPQMYGYAPYSPMNHIQPPYGHPSPQSHTLTSQSMMMPPQTTTAQMSPHQPTHTPNTALSSSPAMKMDPNPQTASQRPMLNPPLPSPNNTGMSAVGMHQNSPMGASSSAAPGPIPATTPLVVRQDGNGVQWIAFEYSRDRVKMEYTIRCDVESVNVDTLGQEFKTENCVYPRACCSKDQYRGNRLVYETECNAVGWALAELNPALRGKRGLIQRAVDSWRNSNQDPRLRSRRVRRQAKLSRRQSVPASTPHMAPATPVGPCLPSTAMPAPTPRPNIGPLSMGPPQLHHHHAQPDGSPKMEVGVSGSEYPGIQRPLNTGRLPGPIHPDIHQAQVFHDTAVPPRAEPSGPSMPPLMRDSGLSALGRHPTIATSSRMDTTGFVVDDEQSPSNEDLFGQLPEGKKRTFILVEDPHRGSRVRVKVMLDKVKMEEIPDSYRKSNAVYPRTYFPVQMKDAPGRILTGRRFFGDDTEQTDDPVDATVGRTTVPTPSLDGERDIDVPKLSRRRHRNEVLMNDLGYRLSWSQSRVFAGRTLFLQRSLDAYRNKMRSSMLAAGQEPSEIPDHFDTRRGKRRFLERGSRRLESGAPSAAQRSAEEVDG